MSVDRPSRPIIRLNRMGNIANYMIQIMAAHTIKSHAPDAVISAEGMPEWNLHFDAVDDASLPSLTVDKHHLNVQRLGALLQTRAVQRLDMMSYAQHMDNFLSRSYYQALFDGSHVEATGFPASHLVINIRAGEILDARHPFYTLLPISFYRDVIRQTGLIPVFMGQLGADPYSAELRAAFPDAVFQPSQGAMRDFETVRRSKNIVPAVSTFSWLAAWLSDADHIHFPLSGLLNPIQVGDIDLLPADDPRYRLYLFPINYAIEVAELIEAHRPIEGLWREVSHAMFKAMRLGQPRFKPELRDWLAVYSEPFYLTCYPDIPIAVREGWFPSGLDHYAAIGVNEGRAAFYFDGGWYSRAYPMAALEVAQGDFQDLRHHYVAIGRQRGYLPIPPAVIG